MRAKSFKHHYIPEFLIKGFNNSDCKVYIYDKEEDKIQHKYRPSASIFFERNRNTVDINDIDNTSVIEDELFHKIDNEFSRLTRKFRERETGVLSEEIVGEFQFFIINLFWRIPSSDGFVKNLIIQADLSATGIDPEILKRDENFHKMERAGLYRHTIDWLNKSSVPESINFVSTKRFESDSLILGDNPILFCSTPRKFTDLGYMDYMFAFSSQGIYISTKTEFGNFTKQMAYDFNACIINQSVKYVVSGDRKLLEDSLEYYRGLKENDLLIKRKDLMFGR